MKLFRISKNINCVEILVVHAGKRNYRFKKMANSFKVEAMI